MATDSRAGFRFEGLLYSNREPTVASFLFSDTETLTKGDIVNVEATANIGEVDLGATGDTEFAGIALETKAGTDSTTWIEVITDEDAVYSVYDLNARAASATLDISGATGAMTVASTSNADLIVVSNSSATERTLVRIKPSAHYLSS